ncbi:MAG: NOB1 family endonuclease [Candidatus Thermoplasmatota archaeon]|nr:NOB1 family endonuclease [Candidatus Thermoplasmatota archaeon]
MLAVLDTSALLSGKRFPGPAVTVPAVVAEFREGGHSWRLLEYARSAGLTVRQPSESSLRRVRGAAERTGDLSHLSRADVEVLALALEVRGGKGPGEAGGEGEVVVFTDDYGIQNVASALGLAHRSVLQPGIRQQWRWFYWCTACGRRFDALHPECPVCGSPLKRVRAP